MGRPAKGQRGGYVGRFTGRRYPYSNPRGYYAWEPQADSFHGRNLAVVQKLLIDLQQYLPLRPRSILYRLMGMGRATKDDGAKVIELCSFGRRAGLIDWDDIDDGRTIERHPAGFDGPAEYFGIMSRRIEQEYQRSLRQGQQYWLEMYVEAGGYISTIERTCFNYGVPVISGSGFNAIGRLRETAIDAVDRWTKDATQTVVLLLGDRDRSGETRVDRVDADIRAFIDGEVANLGGWDDVTSEDILITKHLGLTAAQVQAMKLTPTKSGTVELEAVSPAIVVGWVQAACEWYTNKATLAATKAATAADIEWMTKEMDAFMKRLKRRHLI
jgi:hypothetical protein